MTKENAKNILIVDDEEGVAFFLSENLADLGPEYRVNTVASAEEALRKITQEPFDLIVTDMRLPGITGLDLIRKTRRISPQTRAILITAYGSEAVEAEARSLGTHHYMTKPFAIETFIDVVQGALLAEEESHPSPPLPPKKSSPRVVAPSRLNIPGAKVDRPPRILIVDDNERNVKLLLSILKSRGYELDMAYNGLEALEAVSTHPPDLIMLDVLMPKMDGFQVAEALRSDPTTQHIPILMLTALREVEDKVKGLEAGADDFLIKPFHTVELLARTRSLLRIKQLHDELEQKNDMLESVLTHYVSHAIASEILSNPEQNLQLGGHSCEVSVLFADIRGFTSFSEQHPASKVTEALNYVFNHLVPIIFEQHGTLDKYLGDAVMAFYGAPIASTDSALKAARTACAMQRKFVDVCQETELLCGLGLGIGICTGEAVVGNIGSEQLMDYTVIGKTPNTARRLQEHASAGQILIDQLTYKYIVDHVSTREIMPLMLKGLSSPIPAYEVLWIAGEEPW